MTSHTEDESTIETTETSLTIRRTFDSPRERIFRAFTEPEEIEQWFGPGAMTAEVRVLELETDGVYSVSMLDEENRYEVEGRFVEVVENDRIVHTWEPGLVTIELLDVEDGTEVVLTHEGLPDGEIVDGHAAGWESALDNLAGVL